MNKELILKAKEAKSAEELLALARENNIELTEEQAKECYDRLNSIGELSDDELENIAGGDIKIVLCEGKGGHGWYIRMTAGF